MKRKSILASIVFAGFFAVAIGLAGFGFYSFQKNLTALNESNQENISWPAMQLEQELLRFQESLLKYEAQDNFTQKQLITRFDILWSRVAIFQRGRVGARLREYDRETDVLGRLFADLQEQADVVEAPGVPEIRGLRDIFEQYTIEMRDLSKLIFLGEEKLRSKLNAQMRASANSTLSLSIVAMVFLLAGLGYSSREGRRFRILAQTNRKLADIAEKASQSKTRFLTMMSHELRTPMNGVLGFLALLRQSKISAPQEQLVDHAERSGRQMIGMLSDILDFSTLQNDKLELEEKSFEIAGLVEALADLFGPEARRADIDFDVKYDPFGPTRIAGDFRRLKQIYTQLTSYFIELAGIRRILLDFRVEGDVLTADICLEYSDIKGKWTPDLVLGGRVENSDSFAAQALGPAVARGLISEMRGDLVLGPMDESRVVVAVHIPVVRRSLPVVNIHMDMSSAVMETICKTALRDAPVCFEVQEISANVHIILFETGNMDEAGRVSDLQIKYPKALIIALGRPINPDIFDSVVDIPARMSEKIGPIIHDLMS